MNTSVTKKFTLAMLTAPVLAALAIGLAETAAASPAGPKRSNTGTAATADATPNGGTGTHVGTHPVLQMPGSRPGTHLGARQQQVHAGAGPADGAGPNGIAAEPSTATSQPLRLGAAAASAADCVNCGPTADDGYSMIKEYISMGGPMPGCA